MPPQPAQQLPFDVNLLPFIPFNVASPAVLQTYVDVSQIIAIEETAINLNGEMHFALVLHLRGGGTIAVWDTRRQFTGVILGAMRLHDSIQRARNERRESHDAPATERSK